MNLRAILLTTLALFVLVACAPATSPVTQAPPLAEPTQEEPVAEAVESEATDSSEEMAEEMMDTEDEAGTSEAQVTAPDTTEADAASAASDETVAYNGPEWTTYTLTNARTGESFTLADFAGKAVFVEPMATWCTNCLAQQRNVIAAFAELNQDEVVFISLSVAEQVSNENLAAYADRNGFNWVFAVATAPLTTALTRDFGRTVTAPPSTPHFTIAPSGQVSPLQTGRKSSQQIVAELSALLSS